MPDQIRPIHFTFEVGEFGPDDLLVTSFRGSEAISELYRYEIELASENPDLDFEAVIGQMGKLTWSESTGDRYVHGIVSEIEATGFGKRFARYRATLVPAVWPMTLRRRSRIYEDLEAAEIVRRVLEADGIPADRFRINVHESPHAVHEYRVQYGESDWDFVARLLEEEGFTFIFEQNEDGAVLVIDDRPTAYPAIDGDATVLFRDPGMGAPQGNQVFRFTYARQMRRWQVLLTDYDFKHPSLRLGTGAGNDEGGCTEAEGELADSVYPGRFQELEVGSRLAMSRVNEHRTGVLLGSGKSNEARLRAGLRYTMDGHHRADLNQEYLLIRVTHHGSQEGAAQEESAQESPTVYDNAFECVPEFPYFRAPCRTPHPRVNGVQTARVVGPEGEEIHTDEYGRIRVQFHWNWQEGYHDDASCWIRVAQSWAGPGWGTMFIPRIGHEVVVDFLEGDPDQPLVIGSVYNGTNPPPYPLPDERTKSTIKSDSSLGGGGFNELRFEDAKGSEEIFLHAEKDWNTVVGNDNSESVGHDQSISVGHDRHKVIDNDQTEEVKGNKSVLVRKNYTEEVTQNVSITVNQNRDDHVVGNVNTIIDSNNVLSISGEQAIQVTGQHSLFSVGDQVVQSDAVIRMHGGTQVAIGAPEITIQADNQITLSVGGSQIVITGSSIQITSAQITIGASGPTDLQGATVSIVADTNCTVAAATLTTMADGVNTVRGATVAVNGPSGVTITGATVNLNP
jgi:type VI secretion system secreted protein VgrG